jgi:hypothetical protein
MQLNTNNREADSSDEDYSVVAREGTLHWRRRHRSLCSNDVVRSTEPNLALKKRSKRTVHTIRKQVYMFCWKLPVPFTKSWLCSWLLLKNSPHLLLPNIISIFHVISHFLSTDTRAAVSFLQTMAKRNKWQIESVFHTKCLKLVAHAERISLMVSLVALVTVGRYQDQFVYHISQA